MKDTMFAVITAGKQIIGSMWYLGRDGVRVKVEDRVYTGLCVSDAIFTGETTRTPAGPINLSVLSGYSDVGLVWTN